MLSRGTPGGRGPIGYEDLGPRDAGGPPVVLLHPFPFSRGIWAGLTPVLAARRRVLAVDASGFGETPRSAGFSIAGLADDLAALLEELGVARATLLGMSMGGYTALAFANRHPGKLAALILADARAAADPPAVREGRTAALETIRRAGPDGYLAGSLGKLLSPAAPPALVAHLRAHAERRPPHLIAGIEALRDRPDRTAELAAIRCPTLVVCGAGEQLFPVDELRGMAAAIPGATFALVPDAGHLPHLEAPGAFERIVSAFLSESQSKLLDGPAAGAQP